MGRYVVHQHAARRMHWDLRLQMGQVLRSFAVPKGPSLVPGEKRLAVHTEDHPLEYLDFEDVIPAGNYGAGAMIVWDLGQVAYLEGTGEEGLERGKIDFTLRGFKLNGRFALVHTGRRRPGPAGEGGNEWLLFKKADAHSRPAGVIVEELPRSVLAGLTVEELPRKAELAAELVARAEAWGAPVGEVRAQELTPMLCALEGAGLAEEERLYELKLDGVRIIADKRGDAVSLRYRTRRAATVSYPEIARAVRALSPERVVLDGEIVAFDEQGKPSFQRLAPRIHAQRPRDVLAAQAQVPVSYLVFDLLQIGDRCLLELPLTQRKALLKDLIRGAGLLRALDHLEGHGQALFELCRAEGLEGVVAKRARSPYRPGPSRSTDWVKIKRERDDDFIIVGWVPRKNTEDALGALCLASYGPRVDATSAEVVEADSEDSAADGHTTLHYRGRVGTGFDANALRDLEQRLAGLATSPYPWAGATPLDTKHVRFVRPELVTLVRFSGWTDEGRLRAPVFHGLRSDVTPAACDAAPPSALLGAAPARNELPSDGGAADDSSTGSDGGQEHVTAPPLRKPTPRARVTLSNRSKVFWPEEGYTKGDLWDYYASIAPVMLPFLRGRPVVLVRYPDGVAGKSFYQWRIPAGTPSWIRTLELYDEEKRSERGTGKNVFLIEDADSLLYIANLGCIPLHALAYREGTPEHCDFLTIDLDVGERPFADAVRLALTLHELLQRLKLPSFPKTSGQKGLHVLVPLGPGVEFTTAKLLCELLGQLLVGRHPELATMERKRDKRGGRVYVDTGQTGQSRTIVAPYSARAYPGATVSTPLLWDEVHLALDPGAFTLFTVPERVARLPDPMAPLLSERPDIASAVATLGSWLRPANP
jgi:bifunctional non-homologous end joining protein LigD